MGEGLCRHSSCQSVFAFAIEAIVLLFLCRDFVNHKVVSARNRT